MRELSLHILDIIRNSISAGASNVKLMVMGDKSTDRLSIEVADNGKGMDNNLLQRIYDPFVTSRSTRRVGMGIPLLKDTALRCSGDLIVESKKGLGTIVKTDFMISHIDRPPLGSLGETMADLITGEPQTRFEVELASEKIFFRLDTREIKNRLGKAPINSYEVWEWIKECIDENTKLVFKDILNEVSGQN